MEVALSPEMSKILSMAKPLEPLAPYDTCTHVGKSTALVLPDGDGDHLTLPGTSPGLSLRPTQKKAIWRYLVSGNTLLDHVVGAVRMRRGDDPGLRGRGGLRGGGAANTSIDWAHSTGVPDDTGYRAGWESTN